MDVKTIEKRLRDLRNERGWSLNTAAKRSGLGIRSLHICEQNIQIIRADTIKALAEAYDVSVFYLCGFTESRAIPDRETFLQLIENIPSISDRLLVLRLSIGWSIEKVHRMTGIRPGTICIYESGGHVSRDYADILAGIYGVPLSCIYGDRQLDPLDSASEISFLRKLRLERKWTTAKAAQKAGVSTHTMTNYEIGREILTDQRAAQLADMYEVSFEEMRCAMDVERAHFEEKHPLLAKPSQVCSNLTILRKERYWSTRDVVERTGIPLYAVRNYEAGRRKLSLERANILAKTFGVSIEYIYGATEERGTYQPIEEGCFSGTHHNRLRVFRILRGWSCEEVAKKAGMSRQVYWLYENQKRSISAKHVLKLAELYQVPASLLFVPKKIALSDVEAANLICALQNDSALTTLIRLCMGHTENVKKCLALLRTEGTKE